MVGKGRLRGMVVVKKVSISAGNDMPSDVIHICFNDM